MSLKPAFLALIGVLSFSFSANTLFAQNGVLSEFGIHAGSMAMANAVSSAPDLGPLGYYNPALASFQINDYQIDFSGSSMDFDRSLSAVNGSFKLADNAGLNLYLQGFRISNIQERSTSGYHVRDFNASELRIGTAFGLQFSKRFAAGIGLKINQSRLHPDVQADPSIGLDIGFLVRLTDRIYLSTAFLDLASRYTWDTSDLYGDQQSANLTDQQPSRVVLGASWRNEKFLVSMDYWNVRFTNNTTQSSVSVLDGRPIRFSDRSKESYWLQSLRLGTAIEVHRRLLLQLGYVFGFDQEGGNRLSGGFNLRLPFDQFQPQIQYALNREAHISTLYHTLGLRLAL